MKMTIGIADDHRLFLRSLASLISSFSTCDILIEASHGRDLLQQLEQLAAPPDIVLIDVDMPVLKGDETVKEVVRRWPAIKCIALSMKDDDRSIISMLQAGCCAYLLKDIDTGELEKALEEVYTRGYYNSDIVNINYRRLILAANENVSPTLSEREKVFLQLACSDLTYKQIAAEMHLSERTIDGYREALFEKFKVQSRVGMVLEALRRKIVHL